MHLRPVEHATNRQRVLSARRLWLGVIVKRKPTVREVCESDAIIMPGWSRLHPEPGCRAALRAEERESMARYGVAFAGIDPAPQHYADQGQRDRRSLP